MEFYIYKWFIVDTNFVFYIGKGKNDRYKSMKKRNPYFLNIIKKYNCDVEIIEYCENETVAFEKEKEYIKEFKAKGMAVANFHEGGLGGDVFKYADEETKLQFKEKMTKINQQRCSTKEFKENARKNMVERYKNPEERHKQAEHQKVIWTEEKREQQSQLIKEKAKTNDFHKRGSITRQKKCFFKFNDKEIIFNSRKEALCYIKENYNIVFGRKTEQDMLHNKAPYVAYHKEQKHLNGMLLYYI